MNHRERVLAALDHVEPDKVPMDLGGTLASTVVGPAYANLRMELQLSERDTLEATKYASLADIDEEVRAALDVDIIHAPRAFGSGKRLRNISESTFMDEWGVLWHRPEEGHYYVERPPFADEASPRAVEEHQWPEPKNLVDVEGLADKIEQIRSETDYAVTLELRGRTLSLGQFLRGFGNWMMDLASNGEFVDALMERTTQLQLEANEIILREAGSLVDIVYTADDLGGQNGPLVSPETVKRYFNPHYRRLWGHIRENTSAKLLHHCCGSIYPFISSFVEFGVQALNPIQVSARDMDPGKLKADFGADLTFWGGVDTRDVMPRGTLADVRNEVAKRIKQMGPGGGYVLAAVHNIQPDVPPANIVELYHAGREFGEYPLAIA
jgi:uroporphyrinogen decarboxylase